MSVLSVHKTAENAPTPMMRQYLAIKADYPHAILFYRMGDFYEMFFEDAKIAAPILDIALTKRGEHDGDPIPMAGVPWHQAESYLHKLIAHGLTVAICEQTETPDEAREKRGYKAVVGREVTRIVTPGTLTEDTLLNPKSNNYIASLAKILGLYALAIIDLSTGEFTSQTFPDEGGMYNALGRLKPSEILISEGMERNSLAEFADKVKSLSPVLFDSKAGRDRLLRFYNLESLDPLGEFSQAEVAAAGAVLQYVESTQKGALQSLQKIKSLKNQDYMDIDAASFRNLEILESMRGGVRGSLLSVLDHTKAAMGGRLLRQWLSSPLMNLKDIQARQNACSDFVNDHTLCLEIRDCLSTCPDMERALTRLSLGRGMPRDLATVRDGLKAALVIKQLGRNKPTLSGDTQAPFESLGGHSEIVDLLTRALMPDLPAFAREGGMILKGFSSELDEARRLRDEGRKLMAELQGSYARLSKIPTLKIKHNNILGYFIEVSPKQADGLGDPFIHRQTLASAVRFSTKELNDLEQKITRAGEQVLALEQQIFSDLVARVCDHASAIHETSRALSRLDVLTNFAHLAVLNDYTRPHLDHSSTFLIEGGRHVVVEQSLKKSGEAFIKNSADLSDSHKLWLLTGPNMAGKSTFLRQNALIAILAQCGCFVPADRAHIGLVDKVFSRVGAGDDLARGQSTFMVEMIETATILNQATEKSLVILDEIGRGTATFDGLSIAWACLEYLHDTTRCRGLFATHYHELTALKETLSNLACHTMHVKEWQDKIVFLHEVVAGVADRSYGIHVGELAGLPKSVTQRAKSILQKLESDKNPTALPLFSHATEKGVEQARPHPILEKLKAVNPDSLTPKSALDILYELKKDLV